MFFEDEIGIKPSAWLRYQPLDDFLAVNTFRVQRWEETAVQSLGLHISIIRLIVASVMTLPLGLLHRMVPTATGRHIYSFLAGAALLYYPFGNQISLVFASTILMYLVMIFVPRYANRLSWAIAMPFLLLCLERTGDLWDTGAVDITGSLMVLTLKQIAICHNLSDSYSNKKYSEERFQLRMKSPPNPLHYLSYIFATGNLLAGPFNEFQEYKKFVARDGAWAKAFSWSMFIEAQRAAVRSFGYACAALAGEQVISAFCSARMVLAPAAFRMPLWKRYAIAFAAGFARRCQYYFIWFLSEAGINAQGYGFNGFADSEGKVPLFDRYNNADFAKVESCYSLALLPKCWNVNTGVFLRRYVYERVGKGFAGLAVTQVVSGLWHGLREGHMIFFFLTIFLFQGSKVWYKQEKRLPPHIYESKPWIALKWFVSHTQLNIFALPFILQKWKLCWASAKSFHFVPHIFALGLVVLGAVVPRPRTR
jgi:lysophospholipid acyltransferase